MTTDSPLRGRSILVTRERSQAGALSRLLAAKGASPLECPLIALSPPPDWGPVDAALARLREYDGILFTSANAVRFFAQRLRATGTPLDLVRQVPGFAIGPATARALADEGFPAQAIADLGQAEGVMALLAKGKLAGKRFLFPRAREAREVLPRFLEERGARADLVVVYETRTAHENRPLLWHILKSENLDYLTFTSTSTVTAFGLMMAAVGSPEPSWRAIPAACIGEITAQAARGLGFPRVLAATAPTVQSLVQTITDYDRKGA